MDEGTLMTDHDTPSGEEEACEGPDTEVSSNREPPPGAAEAAAEDARDHPTSPVAPTPDEYMVPGTEDEDHLPVSPG